MVKTINDAFLDLRMTLKEKNVAGYELEARELVCFALKITPEEMRGRKQEYIFDPQLQRIDYLLKLRLSGVPLQHIIGQWEFYSMTFAVTKDTLIPRPDTETLVDCGIAFMKNRSRGRVLDLCCGTGCVGIALLKHSECEINGVLADISKAALKVARDNIATHGVSARCATVLADAIKPLDSALGKFNLILCNPPYIKSQDIATLDIEVQHEPRLALDGGKDGLDFYRAVAKNGRAALVNGGAIMFEVGINQSHDVGGILKENGYLDVAFHKDLCGVERVVTGISKTMENME